MIKYLIKIVYNNKYNLYKFIKNFLRMIYYNNNFKTFKNNF